MYKPGSILITHKHYIGERWGAFVANDKLYEFKWNWSIDWTAPCPNSPIKKEFFHNYEMLTDIFTMSDSQAHPPKLLPEASSSSNSPDGSVNDA